MAQTVIGLFEHESDAQKAIQRLDEIGISQDQVDLSRGNSNRATTSTVSESSRSDRNDDNAITRFFKNLFGDDNDDADRYATIGNQGYSIVTVHANSEDDAERAADILDDCGAIDVDETAQRYSNQPNISGQSYSGTNEGTYSGTDQRQTYTGTDRGDTDRDVTIPKIEEELHVGKRTVEGGGVRVKSRIVEKPVEESIRLREEHVRVDRQPVNRPVSDADRAAFQEQDIELTERSEVPVVNKEARVVEEVRISKEVSERNETIRDTVRNTEVEVDESNRRNISNEDMTGDVEDDDDLNIGNSKRGSLGNTNRGNLNRSDDDLI
jgi:stress response protein YsnF